MGFILVAASCCDSSTMNEQDFSMNSFTYLLILGAGGGLHQFLDFPSAIDEIGQQLGQNSLWKALLRILWERVIILKSHGQVL
jgi:hypothetical protein